MSVFRLFTNVPSLFPGGRRRDLDFDSAVQSDKCSIWRWPGKRFAPTRRDPHRRIAAIERPHSPHIEWLKS